MRNLVSQNPLILASQSPRRKELLTAAGVPIEVIPSNVDESTIQITEPRNHAVHSAQAKATQVSDLHPERWILGADTIVVIDDRIMGKPHSVEDAREMLTRLNGRTHVVYTGFCILNQSRQIRHQDCVTTEVTFKTLRPAEIEWYLRTAEPYDKAGAYAIQGLGTFLVTQIRGSYTNVVGLPVCEVVEFLTRGNLIDLSPTSPEPS